MAASPAVQAPTRPPSLPSLAATFGPFPSPSHPAHQHHAEYPTAPTSASSTSSTIESSAPLTPKDYLPPMPSPPPSTTRSSTRRSPSKLKRADFAVAPIPPFRGAPGERRLGAATAPPTALPPITPSSAVPPSLTKNDRRVSYPSVLAAPSVFSVFSLPAPGPPSRPPVPNGITTGLGIEGVGVGAAESKEALVIERLGEAPSGGKGGRRGSLKRVLVSDEEDQLAPVVQANASGMNGRDPSSFPLPLKRPPSLPRNDSAPSLDRRRADSSSPKHSLGQTGEGGRAGGAGGGGSPTLSNKRPRTRLSPLESLADTATSILSASAPASSQHNNSHTQHAAGPASSSSGVPISSLLSGPTSSSATSPSSALEASKAIKEQQQREIDRRREAAGLAAGPAPGSVQAALGKLRAQQQASTGSTSSSTAAGGGGLAKRRGHRPPAVATGSSAAPASHRRNASTSHTAPAHDFALHHPPLRSAPAVEIPSVLVGSPLEATFAARAAAAREAPQMRPSASSSGAPASSGKKDSRRQSGGNVQPQPPLVSSSSYYIRPNQPLGPGVAFPPAPPSSTSPKTSTAGGRKDDPKQTGPRLPPISRMTSGSRVPQQQQQQQQPPPPLPGLSHSSQSALAHLPGFYPPPPHHLPAYQPHSPLTSAPLGPAPSTPLYPPHPSSAPAPGPASKQAFLGLFSTFYDSLSDSRVLTHSLDFQVQRANAVLSTLQQAEGQLEALVETRVSEVRREWEERWTGVEERLARLERSAGLRAADGFAGLEERLARLERLGNLVTAQQQDQSVGQSSRRTSASTDSGVEGGTEGSVTSVSAGGGAGTAPGEREDEEMRQV